MWNYESLETKVNYLIRNYYCIKLYFKVIMRRKSKNRLKVLKLKVRPIKHSFITLNYFRIKIHNQKFYN